MRIEELSIDDWVQARKLEWDYYNLYITPPMRVVQIGYSEVKLELNGIEHYAFIEDIQPIPLTPEILKKNGLCVVEEDADFSEYELFSSENFSIFHVKGTLRYRLETPQASVVCWFVHQLQHALRLAEVEKEIEI